MDEDKKKEDQEEIDQSQGQEDQTSPNDSNSPDDSNSSDDSNISPESPTPAPEDHGPPPETGPIGGVINVEGKAPPPPKPEANPVQGMLLQGPTTPEQTAQYLKNQDQATYQDLISGHIEPKTFAELFDKNKTLGGKISTLFGLMVSGMGSGLARQPNAVMEMMNKEIANDLEAQKASKANAYNLLRLNQDHQLQEAQKGVFGAQQRNIQADTAIKADALTQMQMNRYYLHQMAQQVQQLQNAATADPGNIQKQQQLQRAQQALGLIANGVDEKNGNLADRAAAMGALIGAQAPSQPEANGGVDLQKLNDLITAGKVNSPLGLSPAEGDQARKEAALVMDNRKVAQLFADSYQNLNQLDAGHLTPGKRDAEINSLMGNIARSTTGMYNAAEAKAQASAMFPEATDTPAIRQEKFRKAMDHFKSMEEATPILNSKGLKGKFPILSPKKDPNEGKVIINKKTGERQIMKNGHWIPLKGI